MFVMVHADMFCLMEKRTRLRSSDGLVGNAEKEVSKTCSNQVKYVIPGTCLHNDVVSPKHYFSHVDVHKT